MGDTESRVPSHCNKASIATKRHLFTGGGPCLQSATTPHLRRSIKRNTIKRGLPILYLCSSHFDLIFIVVLCKSVPFLENANLVTTNLGNI